MKVQKSLKISFSANKRAPVKATSVVSDDDAVTDSSTNSHVSLASKEVNFALDQTVHHQSSYVLTMQLEEELWYCKDECKQMLSSHVSSPAKSLCQASKDPFVQAVERVYKSASSRSGKISSREQATLSQLYQGDYYRAVGLEFKILKVQQKLASKQDVRASLLQFLQKHDAVTAARKCVEQTKGSQRLATCLAQAAAEH
mmetsp:Transcript_8309/g.17320  ORF Transcript_8309/g.17320 Transcript_8309/m.17320 type:complete len:200 (-) Transcript_8309:92-691(-)